MQKFLRNKILFVLLCMPKITRYTYKVRSEKIANFLRNRKWISIIALERELQLPINTIHRAVKSGTTISAKHLDKIENFLNNNFLAYGNDTNI